MRLDDVRGFVFDVDGTLVRRFPDGVHPLPGAVEVLEAIRASGRPLALFSNGSHVPPEVFAEHLRADGLEVSDDEMVSPVRSALSYLRRRHPDGRVLLFAQDPVRERLIDEGIQRRRGRARRRRARAPHRPRGVPGHGTRGARDPRRCPAADRQLPARLRRRQRPDLQPRGDAHGGDREGERRPPDRGRQAVEGGRAGARGAARRSPRRTCSSPATTCGWTSASACAAARGRYWSAAASAARSTCRRCPSAGARTRSSTASANCWLGSSPRCRRPR